MKIKTSKKFFDELDSSHILDMVLIKADEPLIRKALKKSAEYLIQTPEYDGRGTDFEEVDGRDALVYILKTYLLIPRMIKDEAETRARHKMAKLWKNQDDKITDMLISSLPSDAENLSTLTGRQAQEVVKNFLDKLES